MQISPASAILTEVIPVQPVFQLCYGDLYCFLGGGQHHFRLLFLCPQHSPQSRAQGVPLLLMLRA